MDRIKGNSTKRKAIRIAIVVSRFNDFVTKRLLAGCLEELHRLGIKQSQLEVIWVPGSFEIPVVALTQAKRKTVDVVIALGAVIRGQTFHFELVAQAAADGILQASLQTGKPVIFGVLTTDTVRQAYQRSDPKGEHKGKEAARNAVEMAQLLKTFKR